MTPEVRSLLDRSHRLGSDRRNTNWAGGNAWVKAPADDPVTGAPAELLWVKGSGGDLGTLTEAGLAVLRLERLRALAGVYPGVEQPFGPVVEGYEPLTEGERRARAAALAPVLRGLACTDRRQVGCYSDDQAVLDFLARAKHPALAALGSSCPDHFLRTKARPLVLDLPARAPLDQAVERLRELHAAYREDYEAYYRRHATHDSPPMRGADPVIVLVPGVGMFTFGADRQTARVAGEFWVNAVNAMRGAEAVSAYAPIPEAVVRGSGIFAGGWGARSGSRLPAMMET